MPETKYINGCWYIVGKKCDACHGSTRCPHCKGDGWRKGKEGSSKCIACYQKPGSGICNTCKGVGLYPANII